MKQLALLFMFMILISTAYTQEPDTLLQPSPPKRYPIWTLYVPGGTHFYDGRIGTGIFFSALEIGGTALGIAYNDELKERSNSPYYNYPLYVGLNAYGVDKCDFIGNTLTHLKYQNPAFKYDDMPFNKLILEPFRPKNIFTPITISFIALAAAELWLESSNAEFRFRQVDKMHFLNRYINRDQAMGVYGVTSMAMSWEAGVGEEYMFRNFLMPLYDYRFGQKKGLLLSSSIFGAAHALNYLFVESPDPLAILYQVSFTSVLGYILGRNVQKNNYRIGKAVAAHTWYDFTLMLGSFIVNPKENVFGVDIRLKL